MNDLFLRDYKGYRAYRDRLTKQSSLDSCVLSCNSFVGIEIEGEGVDAGNVMQCLDMAECRDWNVERDGSLRGRNFEAVFRNPLSGYRVQQALRRLEEALGPLEDELDFNPRTSVHVHINMHDMPIRKMRLMFGLYLLFEDALFEYAGGNRKHNNYCARLVDDKSVRCVIHSLDPDNKRGIRMLLEDWAAGDGYDVLELNKYAALNLRTLSNFGTMEFRHHPGEYRRDRLFEWVNVLLCLKGWALRSELSLAELPAYMSGLGPEALAAEVFGTYAHCLDYPGLVDGVYDGMRCLQDALVCRADSPALKGSAATKNGGLAGSIRAKREAKNKKKQDAIIGKYASYTSKGLYDVLMDDEGFDPEVREALVSTYKRKLREEREENEREQAEVEGGAEDNEDRVANYVRGARPNRWALDDFVAQLNDLRGEGEPF